MEKIWIPESHLSGPWFQPTQSTVLAINKGVSGVSNRSGNSKQIA